MFKPRDRAEQIIFLAYKVGRLLRDERHRLDDELSPLQMRTLMLLNSVGLTTSEIADKLRIKLPTATLLIDRLESSGLVTRMTGSQDRRKIYVKITDEGEQMMRQSIDLKTKRLKKYLNYLEPQEQKNLLAILHKLYEHLNTEKEEK